MSQSMTLPVSSGAKGPPDGLQLWRQPSDPARDPRRPRLASIPSGVLLDQMVRDDATFREDDLCSETTINSASSAASRGSWIGQFSPFSRVISGVSEASSTGMYAKPEQTLVFLDWDNTLFPSSELENLFPDEIHGSDALPFSPEGEAEMEMWRKAVMDYLIRVRESCARCAIITNSKRPWVHSCISRLHPELAGLIKDEKDTLRDTLHSMKIVYADEEIIEERSSSGGLVPDGCFEGCLQWLEKLIEKEKTDEDQEKEMTDQKHAAMRREAHEFYSRYKNQTWKNILCMGDAKYEHEAMRTLSSVRKLAAPSRERLRTKNIRFKRRPTMKQLAVHLKVATLLHPVFVAFDGDLDVDFNAAEPLKDAARILRIKKIADLAVPMNCDDEDFSEEAASKALWTLECAIDDWLENASAASFRFRGDSL